MKLDTLYDMGDKVTIDDDRSLIGVILALVVRGKNISYEVSYFHNGEKKDLWIEEWRLNKWEG